MKNSKHRFLGIFLTLILSFGFAVQVNAARNNSEGNNNPNKPSKQQTVRSSNHIMGTITAIAGNTVTVSTKEDKASVQKTISFNNKTRFKLDTPKITKSQKDRDSKNTDKKTKPAKNIEPTISDFKVGDSVNIQIRKSNDGSTLASSIRQYTAKNKKK